MHTKTPTIATASGQRGLVPSSILSLGASVPPGGLPSLGDRTHSPVCATPTVPRCRGGKSFWLCRRSLPPHPPHPEPNKQGSGLPPLAVPEAVVGQGCLIKSVSLTQAFPGCSTPVWQGCRPSVPGALAFPALLARVRFLVSGRLVGLAGWVCAVRVGFPLLAGFSSAVVACRWRILGFPVGCSPVPTAPFTPRLRGALRASLAPLLKLIIS